jgi:hypothetical protein
MSPSTRHLARHYVEMVVAMFLGMAVLGMPAGWALGAAGTSWSEFALAPMLLSMLAAMLLHRAEYTHGAHGTHEALAA